MDLRGGAFVRHSERQHGGRRSELRRELSRDAVAVDRIHHPDDHGRPGAGERDAERLGHEVLHAVQEGRAGGTERLNLNWVTFPVN